MADSPLKTRITDAMKDAMRAKDKDTLGAVRLILADIKRIEVDERIDLDEPRIISVLDKMLKQRRDSLSQFEAAGREDLAAKERFEITVIQTFMPMQLTDAEIDQMIAAAMAETGAATAKDMGKVMGLLKPQMQGKADMAVVGQRIKAKLGS